MSSPVARSASWSTACTARPMAVPYRPRCHGGRSRSTGSFASPASLSGGSPPDSSGGSAASDVANRVALIADRTDA